MEAHDVREHDWLQELREVIDGRRAVSVQWLRGLEVFISGIVPPLWDQHGPMELLQATWVCPICGVIDEMKKPEE